MPEKLGLDTPRQFAPLLQPARYLGAYGGRAGGKSHFFAELAIERALLKRFDLVCIREVQQSIKYSVKRLLEQKIVALGVRDYFRPLDDRIESSNGGIFIFQGMNNVTASSIQSLENYDAAWVEEGQNLSQRSLTLLRPTIRKEESQIWFGWNPRFPTDPVDAFLRGADAPSDAIVVRACYRDNPWVSEVSLREAEYDRTRDPERYAHVWLGEYEQHAEARVFKNWTVEEFERPPGTVYRFGADWGYAIDPSVLVRSSIDGRRMYVDYEAYMIGCEITQLPDLFDGVPEARQWFITADSARPETISYMRNNGYPRMNAAVKGPRSLEEGVAFLQSYDLVVHPRCQHVIDELTLYRYKTDPLTGQVLPLLEDKHNHCIDALRYANEGARRAAMDKPQPREAPRPAVRSSPGAWMAG